MKNRSDKYKTVEILSGKADFQKNIIYVRDSTAEGKFEINYEVKVEIERAEDNSPINRKRPN